MTAAQAEPLVEQVADRIRIWSGQKQVLAERLADLRTGPVGDVVDGNQDPAPLALWNLEAPSSPSAPPAVDDLWEPAQLDHWMPVVEESPNPPRSVDRQEPWTGSGPTTGLDRPLGTFDELFEVVSQNSRAPVQVDRPLPPLTRFRVRVAPVAKAGRPTKRNYDYFEELNAALAERAKRSAMDPDRPNGMLDT